MIHSDHIFWPVLAFTFGALWGSFLNVVIYRLPLGRSVVRPGSACGSCELAIPWYHNIPILSWVILRGRCFSCKAPFSIRYPLVEAAVAALAAAVWLKLAHPATGDPAELPRLLTAWVFLFAFVANLMCIALIDMDTMRIPDVLSLPGIALGLATALLVPDVTGVNLEESLLGLLIGGGTLLMVTYGYFALTGREGMGLGDYRLMAMVGAFLGWRSLLWLLVASALQGILFAVLAKVTGLDQALPHPDEFDEPEEPDEAAPDDAEPEDEEDDEDEGFRYMAIPFGPFIALAALEWLVFEPYLMELFNQLVFKP